MPMAGDNKKDKKGFSGLSDLASEISDINKPTKQKGLMPIVGDNEKGKNGLSGLADLTSQVDGIDEPIEEEPKAKSKPSAPKQPPPPQKETSTSKTEQRATSSPSPIKNAKTGKSIGGSISKFILGLVALIIVIWLINDDIQGNRKLSSNPPSSSSQSNSYPQSSSAPTVQTSKSNSAGLRHTKPSVDTMPSTHQTLTSQQPTEQEHAPAPDYTTPTAQPYNYSYQQPPAEHGHLLSLPQLRWCIRENNRIDIMQPYIENTYEFNSIVENFNNRCGKANYYEEDRAIASLDVEKNYNQIYDNAVLYAKEILRKYQSNDNSQQQLSAVGADNETTLSPQRIKKAQKMLAELGYSPHPIDGRYHDQTIAAVKLFENDHNKVMDGRLDELLLNDISSAYLAQRRGKVVKTKPIHNAQKRKRKKTPLKKNKIIFTKGSTKSLVLELQGPPDSITPHHTYEVLHYDYSAVKVSLKDHRVIDWYNTSGNLKVE